MSLFKKVARAFVVIEDDGAAPTSPSVGRSGDAAPSMDDLGSDAADLLAQLNSGPSRSHAQSEPLKPIVTGTGAAGKSRSVPTNSVNTPSQASAPRLASDSPASVPEGNPAAAETGQRPLFTMTASDVFLAAGIADSPSSAERMLKMLAGLAMFPREQQRYMIQAMDAADPTWTEQSVLLDAQARVAALQAHLQSVGQDKTAKQKALMDRMGQTQAKGNEVLSEIDKQINELQKMREEALKETTLEIDRLTSEGRQLEEQARNASAGISQVIGSLNNLMAFLSGSQPPSQPGMPRG